MPFLRVKDVSVHSVGALSAAQDAPARGRVAIVGPRGRPDAVERSRPTQNVAASAQLRGAMALPDVYGMIRRLAMAAEIDSGRWADTRGTMQFHLDGFKPGNPAIFEPGEPRTATHLSDGLPEDVDVLIVGSGPTGLTLAAQLAAFPAMKTRIIEQKSGPLLVGRADGITCRTMEMFKAFGFGERVLKEAYWVNVTSFWKPADNQRANIVRSGRIRDTEDVCRNFPM